MVNGSSRVFMYIYSEMPRWLPEIEKYFLTVCFINSYEGKKNRKWGHIFNEVINSCPHKALTPDSYTLITNLYLQILLVFACLLQL